MCSFPLFWSIFFLNFRVRSVTLQMPASKRILQRLRSPNESRTTRDGSPVQTDSPPLCLSLSSFYPASLTLTKSLFCCSSDDKTVVSKPERRAGRWIRHNRWEIYIFWRQRKKKKRQRLFYRHLMWLSLFFQPEMLGFSHRQERAFVLATNLSQTLKMCC